MNIRASAEARSLGLKLILVGALAFLLWAPAMLIYALVWERSNRADNVRNEIYLLEGGRQTVSGPIILAPAEINTGKTDKDGAPVTRLQVVAFTPQTLNVDADVRTETRRRSIYEASVYDADIRMTGRFGPLNPPPSAEGDVTVFWDQAVIALKFASNNGLKGVRDSLALKLNGRSADAAFEPGVRGLVADLNADVSAPGVSAPLKGVNPAEGFDFDLALPLSGGGALYVAPAGESTATAMRADWPDPSFQGAYLPDEREINASGFTANWRVPYLARNLPRSFVASGGLHELDADKAFGVEFIAAASPYQSVNRALKYALMFLGIVFLTFFLIEATMGGRAHAAQYILLGLTQVLFYLLVLALSEHIGFGAAFGLTATATVALSGYYAATVFHSLLRGAVAFVAFSGAYALIYLLMKSEDYALLIGSVTAFCALALTMTVTRNVDWYGARPKEGLQ